VRDYGLLDSALARPQSSVFGQDAYPTLHGKAGALIHSLLNNHALVDGNKRLGWQATAVFLWINGQDLASPEDEAFEFVMAIAAGEITEVDRIAEWLRQWCAPRWPAPRRAADDA
jgi:death-on-curing protein